MPLVCLPSTYHNNTFYYQLVSYAISSKSVSFQGRLLSVVFIPKSCIMSTGRALFAFIVYVTAVTTITSALHLRSGELFFVHFHVGCDAIFLHTFSAIQDNIKLDFYTAFELHIANETSNIVQILEQINDPAVRLIDLPSTTQVFNLKHLLSIACEPFDNVKCFSLSRLPV